MKASSFFRDAKVVKPVLQETNIQSEQVKPVKRKKSTCERRGKIKIAKSIVKAEKKNEPRLSSGRSIKKPNNSCNNQTIMKENINNNKLTSKETEKSDVPKPENQIQNELKLLITKLKAMKPPEHKPNSKVKFDISSISSLIPPSIEIKDSEQDYYEMAVIFKKLMEILGSISNIPASLDIVLKEVDTFYGKSFLINSLQEQIENQTKIVPRSTSYNIKSKYDELVNALVRHGLRLLFNGTSKQLKALDQNEEEIAELDFVPLSSILGSFSFNVDALHYFIEVSLMILDKNKNLEQITEGRDVITEAYLFLEKLSKKRHIKFLLNNIESSFLFKIFKELDVVESFPEYSHLSTLLQGKLISEEVVVWYEQKFKKNEDSVNIGSMKHKKRSSKRHRKNKRKRESVEKGFSFPELACCEVTCNSCDQETMLKNCIQCLGQSCKNYVHFTAECCIEKRNKKTKGLEYYCLNCGQ